jgi:hypothetical protein
MICEFNNFDEYNDNNCIICLEKSDNIKLCSKCKYLYCTKCSNILNYNCSICFRKKIIVNNNNILNFNIINDYFDIYIDNNQLNFFSFYYNLKLLLRCILEIFLFSMYCGIYFIIAYISVILYGILFD